MRGRSLSRFRSRFGLLTTALLVGLALGAVLVNAPVQLGGQGYFTIPTRPLEKPLTFSEHDYLDVGGVAFRGEAIGRDKMVVVGLEYAPDRPDGDRLITTVMYPDYRTEPLRARIYDWQLVPIANFADSPFDACVTLLGKADDLLDPTPELRATVEANLLQGGFLARYHPAFEHTLLGLRLLQGDMLILRRSSADLFKTGGAYILGAGEDEPVLATNEARFDEVSRWLWDQPNLFSSYIILPPLQSVEFRAHEGLLILTGSPYWAAWRYTDAWQVRAADLKRELVHENNNRVAPLPPEQLWSEIKRRRREMTREDDILQMPEYSQELTAKIERAAGINPAVYNALVTTMRFSAFFRHAKKVNPQGYRRFLGELRGISTAPARPVGMVEVQTPTLIPAP